VAEFSFASSGHLRKLHRFVFWKSFSNRSKMIPDRESAKWFAFDEKHGPCTNTSSFNDDWILPAQRLSFLIIFWLVTSNIPSQNRLRAPPSSISEFKSG
jgi:hypothetical protein